MSRRSALLLVAASGLALEVLDAVREDDRYEVIGCLDDQVAKHGTSWGNQLEVLGGMGVLGEYPDAKVVLCAGKGTTRAGLAERLQLPISRYGSVIDPRSSIGRSCTIGPGAIVLAGAVLTASVNVGAHAVVMPNATITHDGAIGAYATICAGVSLGGSVKIGTRAYIGMNATVRERVEVGPDAIVGMAAAVLADVPASQTWVGIPARPSRPLEANKRSGRKVLA